LQLRDLSAAVVGLTAAYTWQVILRYLMEPSALLAALLVTCLLSLLVAVAWYVTAVAKGQQPRSNSRQSFRSAKHTEPSAERRSSSRTRQTPSVRAPAAV
jgi:hypothetical protein